VEEQVIETEEKSEKKKRIDIIDAARGFAVILMVVHHAFYNTWVFLDGPEWLYRNPVFSVLSYFFVGVFVFVSGISSRFSRGNVERGSKLFVIAMIITYVTLRMEMPIYFGILHLLAVFMIFYGLTRKLWDNINTVAAPIIFIALIIISSVFMAMLSPTMVSTSETPPDNLVLRDLYAVLGWWQKSLNNHDHQEILPYIFVFLLGTWAGGYVREGKLPKWFYDFKIPVFPIIGRNALAIYVLHQPVLYSITMLILYLKT